MNQNALAHFLRKLSFSGLRAVVFSSANNFRFNRSISLKLFCMMFLDTTYQNPEFWLPSINVPEKRFPEIGVGAFCLGHNIGSRGQGVWGYSLKLPAR